MFIYVNLPGGVKYRNHVLLHPDMGQRIQSQSILIGNRGCNFIIGYDKSRLSSRHSRPAMAATRMQSSRLSSRFCAHLAMSIMSALLGKCIRRMSGIDG